MTATFVVSPTVREAVANAAKIQAQADAAWVAAAKANEQEGGPWSITLKFFVCAGISRRDVGMYLNAGSSEMLKWITGNRTPKPAKRSEYVQSLVNELSISPERLEKNCIEVLEGESSMTGRWRWRNW